MLAFPEVVGLPKRLDRGREDHRWHVSRTDPPAKDVPVIDPAEACYVGIRSVTPTGSVSQPLTKANRRGSADSRGSL